ncbi:hypothetical protein VTI74DRAFT_974 [Chaetomium olivicolor]
MGFSGLLGTAGDRAQKPRGTTAHITASPPRTTTPDTPLEHIADESHLKPLDPEAPDLRELNACLDALAAVFPDIQVEVFREMFASFDGESRLALVADALLKNRVSWVKGRWRVVAKDGQPEDVLVPKKETFRSPEYKQAAKTLAWHEFKGLSRSTINAVLAESNYSYLDARQTLVDLSSKSWRFTISSLFLRRKPVSARDAENHPLVIWRSTGHGSIVPTLKSTGNAELDHELFAALIMPIKERTRSKLEAEDRRLAMELNAAQATDLQSTIECACCYADFPFEEFTSCNTQGHMICSKCVQHSITEAVFGQGWNRCIDKDTGTLRCPAVDSDGCDGRIPQHDIHRAMLEVKNGAEILHKLDQRLADHSLLTSGLPLIRCPFCAYAEVNDIYIPPNVSDFRLQPACIVGVICGFLVGILAPVLLPVFLVLFLVASGVYSALNNRQESLLGRLQTEFREALARRRRRLRGLRFDCQNPACRKASCLNCNKAWVDVHVCYESTLTALRTQVEQALSLAIKRVCPRCNTSFVKSSGCNKLTCPCGYQMCYVCRKDIGGDGPGAGYQHFCQHFRPHGDARKCNQCSKCNLWETENMDEVLRKAQEEAERKWKEREQRELSENERVYLETGWSAQATGQGIGAALRRGELPKLAEVFDWVLEHLLK